VMDDVGQKPAMTRKGSLSSLTSSLKKGFRSSSRTNGAAAGGGAADADMNDKWETASNGSISSRTSFASRVSGAKDAVKRRLTAPLNGMSFSKPKVEFSAGDFGETAFHITVQKEESLESENMLELPVGSAFKVVQVNEGFRMKVATQGIQGWITFKVKSNDLLVAKCGSDMQFIVNELHIGSQHEVKSEVTVRVAEPLDSEAKAVLKPGTLVSIMEFGTINKRRAKVSARAVKGLGVEGWISVATKQGELLIGEVTENSKSAAGVEFVPKYLKVKGLLEAAVSGDLAGMKKLVEGSGRMSRLLASDPNRPDLNCCDVRGMTALMYAATFANKPVVDYLVARKEEVDVNALDSTQKSALHHASKRAKSRRTLEYDAAQADIITTLLCCGACLEGRDHNGCTALMFAVANGDEAVTRSLLTAQANVNVQDFEGRMPLDYAQNFGHHKLATLLKAAGAEGHESDDGDPPLQEKPQDEPKAAKQAPPAEGDREDATVLAAPSLSAAEAGVVVEEHAPAETVQAAQAAIEAMAHSSKAAAAPEESAAKETDPPEKKKHKKDKAEKADKGEKVDKGEKADKGERADKADKAERAEKTEKADKAEKPDKAEKGEKAEKAEKSGKSKSEKGERSEKKKSKKTVKEAASAGMMEAIEASEAAPKVAVEQETTQEVDEKQVALATLQALLESSATAGELKAAIKVAEAAGAQEADLQAAEQRIKELKARAKALDQLRQAIAERSVGELQKAIAEAEQTHVDGEQVEEARRVLAEEEPKEKAREQLQAAKEGADIEKLKSAIAQAKKVGLASSELNEFEELLACAESKEKAEAMLKSAMEGKDVSGLKFAIQQAKDAGVDAKLVKQAKQILKEEEPKQNARQLLTAACEACTATALKEAIQAAEAAGLDASEIQEARDVLHHVEEKERKLQSVKNIMQEVKEVSASDIEALRVAKEKLSEVIDRALEAGVAEADLFEAETRRKKLHNAIEDLKGSIRVFCRVRPLSSKEKAQGDTTITKAVDSMTLGIKDNPNFQFDAVFTPGTQAEVFEDCKDLVQSAVDGYNVTMFAYGQTGAGKTYTMYGAPGDEGTAPRTIQEIFRVTEQNKNRFNFTVMGSMLELYRNDLVDLLSKGNPGASKTKLNVRQEKSGMVVVEHLTEQECHCAEELSDLLERGNKQRTVAATAMNSESSRSHLVLLIKIVSVNKETKDVARGKILICDLAGSERLKKSQVTEDMQKEAIEINKSLTALGDVIEGLTKGSKMVPYRNHKLTQLMQDSLGGSAKTLMFVNCSPSSSNLDETVMSLKYATRAKKITNTAKKA